MNMEPLPQDFNNTKTLRWMVHVLAAVVVITTLLGVWPMLVFFGPVVFLSYRYVKRLPYKRVQKRAEALERAQQMGDSESTVQQALHDLEMQKQNRRLSAILAYTFLKR